MLAEPYMYILMQWNFLSLCDSILYWLCGKGAEGIPEQWQRVRERP